MPFIGIFIALEMQTIIIAGIISITLTLKI